ncbi:hypothetical protein JL722_9219 [Aureococcus anophagefferens]|nr:hypothetical protein JL722_9219 [Aureococcus anophagefferens]
MMASYQDVTLTDAQTHEILCGFSTLLDARCVIVEAALARSKAFHRWRRSAAQPVVTPKGSTPKPTLATVAEAAEDATPRKRRRTPLKERFGLENVGHAADDKAPTPRSRQPVSPVPFDGARRSRQPASPLPVDRAPTPRSRQPASPVPPRSRQPASPVPSSAGRSRAQTQGDHPYVPPPRPPPSKSEIKAPAPKEKNVTPRKVRWSPTSPPQSRSPPGARATPVKGSPPAGSGSPAPLARWTAARALGPPVRRDLFSRSPRGGASPVPSHSPRRRAPEAPARRLAAPAGEADGAGFSEAFREAALAAPLPAYTPRQPPPPDSPGVTPPAFVSDASPRFTPAARISPSTPAEQAGAFTGARRAATRRLAGRRHAVHLREAEPVARQVPRRRRPSVAAPPPPDFRGALETPAAPPKLRARSRPSPAAASGWRCSLCYAQNEPVRSQCALCHQLKIRV